MALNELMHFPEVVPLIPGSGVQFLDFGFSIDKQTPVPKEWGYFDVRSTPNIDKVPPCVRRGDEEPRGVESYAVDIKAIEQMFDRVWMPLPLLRREAQGFYRGPTNWARAYLARLEEPDSKGNTYRLVIAADTALLQFVESEAYLAPSPNDARNGREFALPGPKDPIDWYFAESWVRDWCLETFRDMLEREERRRRHFSFRPLTDTEVREQMQGSNEHVARYRAFVELLHALDVLPSFQLVDRITEPRSPPIDVDLVLDLGNSRSCGLLIESDPEQLGVDIAKAVTLQLRDLSRAEQVYSDPFPSRFEFARAQFGRDHLSIRSGRSEAFAWPTVVRVGVEAARLAARRSGTEGSSGLSSPKRYLWDEDARRDSWRFNAAANDGGQSDYATGVAFTTLVNDLGEALHRLKPDLLAQFPDKGFPAIRAQYSRRNLTSFALAEIFVQAIAMMNSPMHRLRRPANANLPRRLRRIIMTMPTAMPLAERDILRKQAEAACDLANLSLGQAQLDYDDDGVAHLSYSVNGAVEDKAPEVILQWDEATATQAVYLYTQVALNHSGDARTFFQNARHPDNQHDPAASQRFRLATIDLGGGTTDLVVTSVVADGVGAHVTLTPEQEFRDGFSLAGDDALLHIVREHVIKPIRRQLREGGMGEKVDFALNEMLGGDHGNMTAVKLVRRQQFAAQIAAPIALGLLQDYEAYDPLAPPPVTTRAFADFFTPDNMPTPGLLDHVNRELAEKGARNFKLQDMVFEISLPDIDRTVRSVFKDMLRALGEIVARYRCDMLILSGRTSRLPAVRAILEESAALPSHRILPLHTFRVGQWYPFRDYRATIGDPKTTAAVGAMICLLGNGQLQNFNFRSNELRVRSTARYFGKLDQSSRMLKADEFYNNLDLDNIEYELPEQPFEFRGPMPLGFRQLPVERWPASRLYTLDYAGPDDANALNPVTPLRITLGRAGKKVTNKRTGEEYMDNPELKIRRVEDRDGRSVATNRLRLRLQTIGQQQGYWLDTGIVQGD
ncbi:virulence factor SrfB [Variovorax rhizosphaerae]|uniref:Virulence factor SrfB n=1 Tax=Variovorax rhizosphaerae TaxID=1836200 RepID=A0ABU8WQZ5_9BURK